MNNNKKDVLFHLFGYDPLFNLPNFTKMQAFVYMCTVCSLRNSN